MPTPLQRRQAMQDYFSCSEGFLKKAPDEEAQAVLAYVRERVLLAEPASDGIRAIDSSRLTPYIAFVPYLSEADLRSTQSAKYMQHAAAMFHTGARSLEVKAWVRYTPAWKALLFMHECYHAWQYCRAPYDASDPRQYNSRERDTHAFQNRLALRWGSGRYQQLLDAELALMEAELKRQGGSVGSRGLIPSGVERRLDAVFGPSRSEGEQKARTAHWVVHINFALIERHAPDHAEGLQTMCYQHLAKHFKTSV